MVELLLIAASAMAGFIGIAFLFKPVADAPAKLDATTSDVAAPKTPPTHPALIGIALLMFAALLGVEAFWSPLGLRDELKAMTEKKPEQAKHMGLGYSPPDEVYGAGRVMEERDGVLQVVEDRDNAIYRAWAPADESKWVLFRSNAERFEVKYPFSPQDQPNNGRPGHKYVMSCDGDRVVLIVDVAPVPDEGSLAHFNAGIERNRQAGRIVVNNIQYGEHPLAKSDIQITAMGREFRMRERIYERDGLTYDVTAMVDVKTKGEAAESAESSVQRFFASFELIDAP